LEVLDYNSRIHDGAGIDLLHIKRLFLLKRERNKPPLSLKSVGEAKLFLSNQKNCGKEHLALFFLDLLR